MVSLPMTHSWVIELIFPFWSKPSTVLLPHLLQRLNHSKLCVTVSLPEVRVVEGTFKLPQVCLGSSLVWKADGLFGEPVHLVWQDNKGGRAGKEVRLGRANVMQALSKSDPIQKVGSLASSQRKISKKFPQKRVTRSIKKSKNGTLCKSEGEEIVKPLAKSKAFTAVKNLVRWVFIFVEISSSI